MPFIQELPQWGAAGTKPPQSKLDTGWAAGDKPPADWLNWKENRTYLALQELQQKALHKDDFVVNDATTAQKGIVQLNDATNSTSTTQAATANAVKKAYDLANSKTSFNGDYNSLTNKPTIPTKTSQLTNDSSFITASQVPAQTATNTTITDTGDHFTSNNVEGALDELFTFASNGKSSIAAAAGSPSVSSDTFTKLAGDISSGKASIASAARGKGASVSDTATFGQIAAAVGGIVHGASGTGSVSTTATSTQTVTVTGLNFTPTKIMFRATNNSLSNWEVDATLLSGVKKYLIGTSNGNTTGYVAQNLTPTSNGFTVQIKNNTTGRNDPYSYEWFAE